jgi:phosphatidylserine/phosphatidylglycerophosphate/cardiolipin synthase-like enzyme
MDELLDYLQESISDEVFSKSEKRTWKSLLNEKNLDQHQLNFLRSKIYEIAKEKANTNNFQFIIEWVRVAISALEQPKASSSDAYFSPGDSCRNVIRRQIEMATQQLDICVFTISDDSIASSLLTAHQKGVDIKLITDNDKSFDQGSDIAELAKAGIAVKMDSTPNHMHHKFMLADQRSLITGSYNWTRSAARYNHENILLTQDPAVIKSYANEFEQLWRLMEPFK